ncbi:TPM domain-containing protein [Nitrospira sp. T9]|uniref:TPM domain-containing protein n=1 Tax=unclassified Nitrospira TaxID=2652172 RepID=UPI003F9AC403
MMRRRPGQSLYRLAWLGLLSIFFLASSGWCLDVPPLTGRVVDQAHLLSPSAISDLNAALAAHESKTSNQVAVLTIASLEGHPLEEFSHQVATAWALGQKGTDNGILFLIALQEKKVRIEVGYGFEGTLTDAKSSRIIRHEVVPRFRAGDFSGGIIAGTHAILGTIDGTYTNTTSSADNNAGHVGLWEIFGLAVAVGTVVGLFLGSRRRVNGSVIGMLLSFVVAFPAALWLGMLASVATSLLVGLFNSVGGPSTRHPLGYGSNVGWPGQSWPMGGSGGFGGGSGGFGGGGGSFGGGGASGSW